MAVFKCKMCGGDLEIAQGACVAECEYCGSKQTVPKVNDEVIQNLFNRANILRLKCDFDKAEQIYEKILLQNDAEPEAHWGIVLCKYGIEYVEDPKTFKRIPTCHRTSYDAVTADADYLAAVQYADVEQKGFYEAEAAVIDDIQKNILNIVKNEAPFDVFICYKETDETGKRTIDSTIANDIYYQLTTEGLKVFYAAVTLEDKLGEEYEPYIFAALNSAKVMLVIGTKPQFFSSVWVKNEWSRFLKLMKSDRSRLLIPCYRDMDAYELPEEFAHLQAQDMSKIGFISDVIRGVKKITAKEENKSDDGENAIKTVGAPTNTAPLLERAFMFLEDGEWTRADDFAEQVLNIDPKNATAYLCKLMCDMEVCTCEDLKNCAEPFDGNNNYQKVIRFADDELKTKLAGYVEYIITRNENARLEHIYNTAKNKMTYATDEDRFITAAEMFEAISGYLDSDELAKQCRENAEIMRQKLEQARLKSAYNQAKIKMARATTEIEFKYSAEQFESISGYLDSDELAKQCREKALQEVEKIRKEQERIAKKRKKIAIIASSCVCVVIAFAILLDTVIIPGSKYNKAVALMEAGKYTEAINAFVLLEGYKDSYVKILQCHYENAVELLEAGNHKKAAMMFGAAGDYKDAKEKSFALWEDIAVRGTISAEYYHTVGLKSDGTVVAVGRNYSGQCDVSKWTDIVAISAGEHHTVGLKSNGKVVAVGSNGYGRCDVSKWTDIVAISAGDWHTVGLKSDGTVVESYGGSLYDVSGWTNIVAISAGDEHTVGLKSDGTVVAVGRNYSGQCDVSKWKNIVAISAGDNHTVGLKSDGTVVAVGDNDNGQCDVSKWTDIVAISAGKYHTVGLKSDGTVVAVGRSYEGQCKVSEWTDIVAISAGDAYTVGLKSDGTVVAVGNNDYGRCDVSEWTDINQPNK